MPRVSNTGLVDREDSTHVVPVTDTIKHEATALGDCVCGVAVSYDDDYGTPRYEHFELGGSSETVS
jgi:hypothetical protein